MKSIKNAVALAAALAMVACGQPAADKSADDAATPPVASESGATTSADGVAARLSATGACFTRDYDAAHLAAHPQQTVTHFHVGDAGEAWRSVQPPGRITIAFGFRVTGKPDLYSGVASCAPAGDAVLCEIEGDGGSFTVELQGDGVRVVAARIEVEGERDFSPDLAQADNRVMLLNSAPAGACSTG